MARHVIWPVSRVIPRRYSFNTTTTPTIDFLFYLTSNIGYFFSYYSETIALSNIFLLKNFVKDLEVFYYRQNSLTKFSYFNFVQCDT